MILFATSGLTYVLNMFSFIRRRSAVDLLFYSGRQTRAAYVQHKLRRMGKTRGTCRVPEMLGRADLMRDCSRLVSIRLVASGDQHAQASDAPALCQTESPSERWICVLQVTCFDGAVGQVAGVCLHCPAATPRAEGPTAPQKTVTLSVQDLQKAAVAGCATDCCCLWAGG